MKTLVIGIDGADWDIIEPLVAAGELSNVKELMDCGYAGDLESVTPPVSAPAWASFSTGTNPGKHGIYDFMEFDSQYNRRWLSSSDKQATPFWEILNDNGVDTGIFKVPLTYPPTPVDGFIVSGFPTPSGATDFTQPQSLAESIGGATSLFEDNYLQISGKYKAFREDLLDVARHQTEQFIEVAEEYDPQFLMTVYDGADRVQHYYWQYFDESHPNHEPDPEVGDPITEYYRLVDDAIGELRMRLCDEGNVLLISDHGFGPLVYDLQIEQWLRENGFQHIDDRFSPMSKVKNLTVGAIDLVWDTLRKLDVEDVSMRLAPTPLVETGRKLKYSGRGVLDWQQTDAFFTSPAGRGLIINLEERFEEGSVTADEYDDVVRKISVELQDLIHPATGAQIVRSVHHRSDIWNGWALNEGPDLIVETDPRYALKGGSADGIVTPATKSGHRRTGDHRKNGIIVCDGPAFQSGSGEEVNLIDVAPTLLYLMDCPIPTKMDGDVALSILDDVTMAKTELRRTEEYGRSDKSAQDWADRESEELENRLEHLGYLG